MNLTNTTVSTAMGSLMDPFLNGFLFVVVIVILLMFNRKLGVVLGILSMVMRNVQLGALRFSSRLGVSLDNRGCSPFGRWCGGVWKMVVVLGLNLVNTTLTFNVTTVNSTFNVKVTNRTTVNN